MLKIENFQIQGNTYNLKDQLRDLGACWNKDKKCYCVDKYTIDAVQKLLDKVNVDTDVFIKECWSKALEKYDLQMVSKQHPLYPDILASFKTFKGKYYL